MTRRLSKGRNVLLLDLFIQMDMNSGHEGYQIWLSVQQQKDIKIGENICVLDQYVSIDFAPVDIENILLILKIVFTELQQQSGSLKKIVCQRYQSFSETAIYHYLTRYSWLLYALGMVFNLYCYLAIISGNRPSPYPMPQPAPVVAYQQPAPYGERKLTDLELIRQEYEEARARAYRKKMIAKAMANSAPHPPNKWVKNVTLRLKTKTIPLPEAVHLPDVIEEPIEQNAPPIPAHIRLFNAYARLIEAWQRVFLSSAHEIESQLEVNCKLGSSLCVSSNHRSDLKFFFMPEKKAVGFGYSYSIPNVGKERGVLTVTLERFNTIYPSNTSLLRPSIVYRVNKVNYHVTFNFGLMSCRHGAHKLIRPYAGFTCQLGFPKKKALVPRLRGGSDGGSFDDQPYSVVPPQEAGINQNMVNVEDDTVSSFFSLPSVSSEEYEEHDNRNMVNVENDAVSSIFSFPSFSSEEYEERESLETVCDAFGLPHFVASHDVTAEDLDEFLTHYGLLEEFLNEDYSFDRQELFHAWIRWKHFGNTVYYTTADAQLLNTFPSKFKQKVEKGRIEKYLSSKNLSFLPVEIDGKIITKTDIDFFLSFYCSTNLDSDDLFDLSKLNQQQLEGYKMVFIAQVGLGKGQITPLQVGIIVTAGHQILESVEKGVSVPLIIGGENSILTPISKEVGHHLGVSFGKGLATSVFKSPVTAFLGACSGFLFKGALGSIVGGSSLLTVNAIMRFISAQAKDAEKAREEKLQRFLDALEASRNADNFDE